jgi:hypothetical protein
MRRFEVYSGNTLVGWSDLESVDRSMATAFGILVTAEGYARIRDQAISLRDTDQSELGLNVRLTSGMSVCCDFTHVADYSKDIAVDGIEISVHGINDPSIEVLFPEF